MIADTRAALDAAIDEIQCRRCDSDDPVSSSARTALDRAIAAHVEAEVAARTAALRRDLDEARGLRHVVCDRCGDPIQRVSPGRVSCPCVEAEVAWRLEAAPEVEEAIDRMTIMVPVGTPMDRAALLAAIAADRARAVAEVIGKLLAAAGVDEREITGMPPFEQVGYVVRWVQGAGAAYRGARETSEKLHEARKAIDWQTARPTPDEARRLVMDLYLALGPPVEEPDAAVTARTALLRALGVEA